MKRSEPDCLRVSITKRYNLTPRQYKTMSKRLMAQVCMCKSEAARRLILGVSK